jgi:hypothetical protein
MVCGCSYSSPSRTLPGTSYGEQLAQRLGWDLVHYARAGCSNGGIRIQIDEAIRQRPDFTIIGLTFHDRMELPATAAPYTPGANEWKGVHPDLEAHLQNTSIENGYVFGEGIKNVNYRHRPYNMICETIFSLAENYEHDYRSQRLDKDTQNAVKQYINYMYDSNWKLQRDLWMMRDGLTEMWAAGLKFLVIPDQLWRRFPLETFYTDFMHKFIPRKHFILDQDYTPMNACNRYPFTGEDPGYHGSPESQKFMADHYYDIITKWDTL